MHPAVLTWKAFRAVTWLLPELSIRRSALCMHGMADTSWLELQGPSQCPHAKAHTCPMWQLSFWQQDTTPAPLPSLFSQQQWAVILSGVRVGPGLQVAPTTKPKACRARCMTAKCSSGAGMLGTSSPPRWRLAGVLRNSLMLFSCGVEGKLDTN